MLIITLQIRQVFKYPSFTINILREYVMEPVEKIL